MNDKPPWIILFLPLLAAVLIGLFGQKEPRTSAALSVAAVVAAFFCSVILWTGTLGDLVGDNPRIWRRGISSRLKALSPGCRSGRLHVHFAVTVDPLSMVMLLVVTGVGSLIHIYSVAYMRGDRGYVRFFACMSFFTFSMLGVVLSNNFLQMFIFWELVGVSSYLLIGFWYERPAAADAAKKAFLTNRLGDFGFLAGIIMIWAAAGTLNFGSLENDFIINPTKVGTIGGLLIFCGAVGKSAQFPLHVWLPDAMEGPTPVSALIHAATMVAAGVYMVCRVFFVFDPTAQTVIAWVGGFTALLAALIAVQQNDIKRILAYSTLSQLGYMVMAAGLSAPAGGHVSSGHPRLFQGAAVPGRRLGHPRLEPRAGYMENGALAGQNAGDGPDLSHRHPGLVRASALERILQQGRHFGRRLQRKPGVVWHRRGGRCSHHLLHVPARLRGVLGPGKIRPAGPRPRVAPADDLSADRAWPSPRWSPEVWAFSGLLTGSFSWLTGNTSRSGPGGWILFIITDWGFALRQMKEEVLEPFHSAPVPALCGLGAILFGFLAAWGLYRNADSDPLPESLPALVPPAAQQVLL